MLIILKKYTVMQNLTFAEKNNLEGGDALICPKSHAEIVEHYVIYLGNSYGTEVYMDNNVKEGVRFLTEERLLNENFKFHRIRKFVGDQFQRNFAIDRAVKLHRKPYHLTQFNCEHFANYVQYNTPVSKQVNNGLGIAAVAGLALLYAAFSEPEKPKKYYRNSRNRYTYY
jgi:hypothetical protein